MYASSPSYRQYYDCRLFISQSQVPLPSHSTNVFTEASSHLIIRLLLSSIRDSADFKCTRFLILCTAQTRKNTLRVRAETSSLATGGIPISGLQHTMPSLEPRSTVEHLDRPSAYYLNKVSSMLLSEMNNTQRLSTVHADFAQNKRRRDRDDEEVDAPQEPQEDPLAHATTLYVGNLCVKTFPSGLSRSQFANIDLQLVLHNRRASVRIIFQVW